MSAYGDDDMETWAPEDRRCLECEMPLALDGKCENDDCPVDADVPEIIYDGDLDQEFEIDEDDEFEKIEEIDHEF